MTAPDDEPGAEDSQQLYRQRFERRRLTAALLRALIDREDLSGEDLEDVLEVTLDRVRSTLTAEAAFYVLLLPEAGEARVVECLLPEVWGCAGRGLPPADERRRLLKQARFPLTSLGFLAQEGLRRQLWRAEDSGDEVDLPQPLLDALGCPLLSLAAVPQELAPDQQALLVVCNKRGRGFTSTDLELLDEVGEVSRRALQRALELAPALDEEERARYVALLSGFALLPPDAEIDPSLIKRFNDRHLRQYMVLPVAVLEGRGLKAAVANPLDLQALRDFEAVSSCRIAEKMIAPPTRIIALLDQAVGAPAPPGAPPRGQTPELVKRVTTSLQRRDNPDYAQLSHEKVNEHSAPIVRLANQLIEEAYHAGASDVHIEVQERGVVVRERVDGICREKLVLPRAAARALVARIKVMSELDIAEHRLPQDGRLAFKRFHPTLDLDLRVSVLPLLHGEGVCLRILDKQRSTLPLDALGFSHYNLERYRGVIQAPFGMILHCGPTGSGKSMTLYAALNEINDPGWKVLTAEDPVEYTLPGINQLQVRKAIGLSFAAALRCFLRHDPDIILVGEIRDAETARIAVEAAMTGHLLLSTLHTNDAASAVTRLGRLEVEPFLLAGTLVSVCAQRLVRRLCTACRQPQAPTPREAALLKRARDEAPIGELYRPVGCGKCRNTGYKGRTGLHELLNVGSRLRQEISEGASAEAIVESGRRQGMRTLFEDGMEKVKAGVTSLEEILTQCRPDEGPGV